MVSQRTESSAWVLVTQISFGFLNKQGEKQVGVNTELKKSFTFKCSFKNIDSNLLCHNKDVSYL